MAGLLLFTGTAAFTIVMIICESLRSGYSVSGDYISTLGVGTHAYLFNSATVFMGSLIVLSGLILLTERKTEPWIPAMIIAGFGAIGVGLFPMGSPYALHTIFSAMVFGFAGISAILFTLVRLWPLRIVSLGLGIFTLSALGLYSSDNFLSLGAGGMERMIAYPAILWAMIISGSLMSGKRAGGS